MNMLDGPGPGRWAKTQMERRRKWEERFGKPRRFKDEKWPDIK